jgi:hypothetical protein
MKEGSTASGEAPASEHNPEQGHVFRNIVLFGALSALIAIGGTWLLYGEAIRLPFLFDDMIHLRWLDWHPLPDIWTTAEGLGYYRPLTMSVWKASELLLGYDDPGLYHSLNLILHALNTLLVALIARRVYRGRGHFIYALLASVIFLTFPFSYQAVPSSSSLSKPLIATLTVGSALLYWEYRRRRSAWLLGISLVTAFLAPFAYESGVMVPVAILAVELLAYSRREFDRLAWLPILFMVLVWGAALPIVILMEPETGASLGLPALKDLWQNGVYFMEGLLFPITPLATPLEQVLGMDRYLVLGLVDLLGFTLLCLFYWWVKQIRILLYGLSWFVVGVLPLWFMLDFGYVITSPRLLYLGAVGSVLLWAGIPVLLWIKLPTRRWAKALAVATIGGILLFNVAYVRHRMDMANTLSAPLWQAARAAETRGDSSSLLYLNVPAWIAPKEPVYRVGTEGLTFIPGYVRIQDFVYVTTGVEPEIRSFMFDPAKQDWDQYIGYAGTELDWEGLAEEIRWADAVYLTSYSPASLSFVEAGALESSATPPDLEAAVARFHDQILLLDYQILPSNEELALHLWWYALEVPGGDVTVFAHVYDASGQLVTQADGYPLLGLLPTGLWQAGDLVHDIRYITLPDDLKDQDYTVAVGWYDTSSGARLPAFDAQGQPLMQDAQQLTP